MSKSSRSAFAQERLRKQIKRNVREAGPRGARRARTKLGIFAETFFVADDHRVNHKPTYW